MNDIQYPYSDELMIWDEYEGRYMLTEEALNQRGMNIRARASRNKANVPDNVINGFIHLATEHIYNYIHEFSLNNERQDKLIATIPSARKIIYRALINQALFIYKNGDWHLSKEEYERDNAISPECIRALNTTIRELGSSILYTGV